MILDGDLFFPSDSRPVRRAVQPLSALNIVLSPRATPSNDVPVILSVYLFISFFSRQIHSIRYCNNSYDRRDRELWYYSNSHPFYTYVAATRIHSSRLTQYYILIRTYIYIYISLDRRCSVSCVSEITPEKKIKYTDYTQRNSRCMSHRGEHTLSNLFIFLIY